MTRLCQLGILVVFLIVVSGCAPSAPATVELTAEQKVAIEETAARVVSSTQTLAAGLPAVDRVQEGENGNGSACPAITLQLIESALTLELDYGAGCVAVNQGNSIISGALAITGNADTRTLDFTYDQLTVDSRSVDGAINLTFMPVAGATTVDAAFTITTSDHGQATGDASVRINFTTSQMTMTSGMLTFMNLDDETSIAVAENLFYDPVQFGNFIPAGGTITFEVLNEATPAVDDTVEIVVTFDAQSPVTGVVHVTIGRVDAGSVTLPNAGPAL